MLMRTISLNNWIDPTNNKVKTKMWNKKGVNNGWVWAGIALVAFWLVSTGVIPNPFAATPAAPVVPTEPGVTPGLPCIYDGVTMTVGPMYKMYTTTSLSGEYARVIVKGSDRGLKADSTTLSVNHGDDIAMYYGENSSGYYAAEQKFTVPCTSAFSTGESDLDPNNAHKLYEHDAALTLRIFCEDDGLLNDDTNTEALATDEVVDLKGTFISTSQDGFSPYGDIIMTCLYNNTALDGLDVTSSDKTVTDEAVPGFRTAGNQTTGYTLDSWRLSPGIFDNANRQFDFFLNIDTDDAAAVSENNISCWFDDEDWYQHTDGDINPATGNNMWLGVEKDDDSQVGVTVDNAIIIRIT